MTHPWIAIVNHEQNMNAPQAVTERYVSNLLHYGRNKEFDIDMVVRRSTYVNNQHVGFYFSVKVEKQGEVVECSGATLAQATRRALEAHGVTFR